MFHTYERAFKIIDDMAISSYMWSNERFSYKSKPPTMKVVNEDDLYQQILKVLNCLETTVKLIRVEPCSENQSKKASYIGKREQYQYLNTYNLG